MAWREHEDPTTFSKAHIYLYTAPDPTTSRESVDWDLAIRAGHGWGGWT